MSTRRRNSRILRATLVAVLAFVLATGYSSHPLATAAPNSADAARKIDGAVTKSLTETGSATFMVTLNSEADLSSVSSAGGAGGKRTAEVFNAKTSHADQTQAGLREFLTARDADFTPFWITNMIKVTGDEALVNEIAARPEVKQIQLDRAFELPKPTPAQAQAQVDAVEWNIDRVRANKVWSDFDARGENVVVANIGSGVEFTHPALVNQYRGNNGDGTFNHNYNWHDPGNSCASKAPCTTFFFERGTRQLGVMIGDDGGANHVGVAPGAKWIATSPCGDFSCVESELLAAGQWVLAPTDLNGQNPRPDLAPDIVNNGWAGNVVSNDTWYMATVDAWVAAGIFPAFSNGDFGELGCASSFSPSNYPAAYSVTMFDINNNRHGLASRGPGMGGVIKPNIAAPGDGIRSASKNGGYAVFTGSDMAVSHVAGSVALLWSAAPKLVGDINATKALLNKTALDTPNERCGGTPQNNNEWGEGKLDAFAAVQAAPRSAAGAISGTVTSGGQPVAGAKITFNRPAPATRITGADGKFTFPFVAVGDYTVKATKFGLATKELKVTVTEGQTATPAFDLAPAPSFTVRGVVKAADGSKLAGAEVSVADTPLAPVTTDKDGAYTITGVSAGSYQIVADYGRWLQTQRKSVNVDGNLTVDLTLQAKVDDYGHTPRHVTPSWVAASTPLHFTGDSTPVTLPFPVTFYGKTYKTATVHTDGYLAFAETGAPGGAIPATRAPNGAIYAFWDDLVVDAQAIVRTSTDGAAPNRRYIVEWNNVTVKSAPGSRLSAELILTEDGRVQLQYNGIDPASPAESGAGATVGLEDEAGLVALPYSVKRPHLSDTVAISVQVPNTGLVRGTITDANDHQPIADATVALSTGNRTFTTTTDAAGFYQAQVPFSLYNLSVSKANYRTSASLVFVAHPFAQIKDAALRTANFTANPSPLEFTVPAGQTRSQALTVRNSGSAKGTFEVKEAQGGFTSQAQVQAPQLPQGVDPDVRDPQHQVAKSESATATPAKVIKSWPFTNVSRGFGIAAGNGSVWLSDGDLNTIGQFTPDGVFIKEFPSKAQFFPADLTYVPSRNQVCAASVGGDNAIRCYNPETGEVVHTITGFWSIVSQRGLAYRADDDTFYIGTFSLGVIYKIKGPSYPDPGAVISQCTPKGTGTDITGLAYSPRGVLWITKGLNTTDDTITAVNPDTCAEITSIADPEPGLIGGTGVDIDDNGNLWTISRKIGLQKASLVETPFPTFTDVPWLSQNVTSGSLDPGSEQQVQVSVNTTGLQPGVYGATIFLVTNAAKNSTVAVPVRLVVTDPATTDEPISQPPGLPNGTRPN